MKATRPLLGPASDGGYYLLGLKQAHPRIFDDIEWSTSRVADQTIERAREIGLDVHVLAPWYDIDDIDGLRILQAELNAGHSFDGALKPHRALHPAELMKSLLRTTDLARRVAGSGRSHIVTGIVDGSTYLLSYPDRPSFLPARPVSHHGSTFSQIRG